MPKPRKSSVVASVCFSLGLGVCLFYVLLSTGRGYGGVVTCMVCTYGMNVWIYLYLYVDVLAEVRIMVE